MKYRLNWTMITIHTFGAVLSGTAFLLCVAGCENNAITGTYTWPLRAEVPVASFMPKEVNQMYLDDGALTVELLGRGFAWLDTGTHDSLIEASMFVQTVEKRQGFKIACLEEIAWRNGWLDDDGVKRAAKRLEKTGYGQYLLDLLRARPRQY